MSPDRPKRSNGHDLIGTTEVAQILNVSRSSVLRWIERGDIPAVQLPSGRWRVPREAVDALLKQLQGRD